MARMTFLEDRRRKRSQDPLVALHYQLAQARHEGRLEAIVIADDAGVVVAGAGAWAVCEELAAYAPLLAQGVWTEPGMATQSRVAELRTEVDVQPVELDGQRVLLCARGGCARWRWSGPPKGSRGSSLGLLRPVRRQLPRISLACSASFGSTWSRMPMLSARYGMTPPA